MEKNEVESFFEKIKQGKIDKLVAVGFTKEQAQVLIEMMQTNSMGFGFL